MTPRRKRRQLDRWLTGWIITTLAIFLLLFVIPLILIITTRSPHP